MKRRLLIVAIFLLAGAVMNVAVAWGCGIRPNTIDAGGYEFLDHVNYPNDNKWFEWWTAHAPSGFASEPNLFVMGTAEFGISTMTLGASADLKFLEQPQQQVTRLRSGLPMLSMEGSVWFHLPSVRTIYDAAIKTAS